MDGHQRLLHNEWIQESVKNDESGFRQRDDVLDGKRLKNDDKSGDHFHSGEFTWPMGQIVYGLPAYLSIGIPRRLNVTDNTDVFVLLNRSE